MQNQKLKKTNQAKREKKTQVKSSRKQSQQCDIAIAGASLTGQILSLILKDRFKVKLIDQSLPKENLTQKGGRALALSLSSINYLITMGFAKNLDEFKSHFYQPQLNLNAISQLEISEHQKKFKAQFSASEYQLPFLGLCIQASALIAVLVQKNQGFIDENWIQSRVKSYHSDGTRVKLKLENHQNINAKLVIFATGNQSKLNEDFNQQTMPDDFQMVSRIRDKVNQISQSNVNQKDKQFALVGSIGLGLNHKAYQRYSDKGVIALLPIEPKKAAWIYSFNQEQKENLEPIFENQSSHKLNPVAKEKITRLLGEIYPEYAQDINEQSLNFGGLWPITKVYSKRVYQNRCILMGAGAISFSPIAAQGINLTIKDCYQLYQTLNEHISIGSLSEFAVKVEKNHQKIQLFMNALEAVAYKRNQLNSPLISNILQTGLISLNIPYFKERFLDYFVGLK